MRSICHLLDAPLDADSEVARHATRALESVSLSDLLQRLGTIVRSRLGLDIAKQAAQVIRGDLALRVLGKAIGSHSKRFSETNAARDFTEAKISRFLSGSSSRVTP